MKNSKQFLKSIFEFVETPKKQREVSDKFKMTLKMRDWAFDNLKDCIETFCDSETRSKFVRQLPNSNFQCPYSVKLPEDFVSRLEDEIKPNPGINIRQLYQKRGFPKLLIESAIEENLIYCVKNPHQPTRPQRLLFWGETHSALAKGTQIEVDEETKRKKKEAEELKRYERSLKYVEDVERFTYYYARKFFPHLIKYHYEDVKQVSLLAADFLRGPRVKTKLLADVLNTRFYHDSKELGWRRVNNKWVKDDPYEEGR